MKVMLLDRFGKKRTHANGQKSDWCLRMLINKVSRLKFTSSLLKGTGNNFGCNLICMVGKQEGNLRKAFKPPRQALPESLGSPENAYRQITKEMHLGTAPEWDAGTQQMKRFTATKTELSAQQSKGKPRQTQRWKGMWYGIEKTSVWTSPISKTNGQRVSTESLTEPAKTMTKRSFG